MKTMSAIRARVRQMLRDEFKPGETFKWEDDELDQYIQQVVGEISGRRPRIVKETLTTTDGSRELDVSGIEDLDDIEKLEYKVGSYPRNNRNVVWIDDDTIEIGVAGLPGDSEDVYVYCEKPHELTDTSSTLRPQMETALVLGAVAYAAVAKAQYHIGKVSVGGVRTPTELQSWGMTKMALYHSALDRLTKPKTSTEYPKD